MLHPSGSNGALSLLVWLLATTCSSAQALGKMTAGESPVLSENDKVVVIDALGAALADDSGLTREASAQSLGKIGGDKARQILIDKQDKDKEEESLIAKETATFDALGHQFEKQILQESTDDICLNFGGSAVEAQFESSMGETYKVTDNIYARKSEAKYLRCFVSVKAIKKLEAMLVRGAEHYDHEVQMLAAESLGEIGGTKTSFTDNEREPIMNALLLATRALQEALKDKDNDSLVRDRSAKALGKIGGGSFCPIGADKDAVIDALGAALADDDDDSSMTREASAQSLGMIGGNRAQRILKKKQAKDKKVDDENAPKKKALGKKVANTLKELGPDAEEPKIDEDDLHSMMVALHSARHNIDRGPGEKWNRNDNSDKEKLMGLIKRLVTLRGETDRVRNAVTASLDTLAKIEN